MTTTPRPDPALLGKRPLLDPFYAAVEAVLVDQRPLIDRLLIGLLTDGHLLLEGVPGLAKTLAVRTVAAALDLKYSRIQFTPDLLPADVIGTLIYNPKSGEFTVRQGPVFANVVLADEINRAPAKVQSALLEAMQERQVTLGDATHELPDPFFVLATQNPLEQEGTYPLPEAQVDRFLLKVVVDYPSAAAEKEILNRFGRLENKLEMKPVLSRDTLRELRSAVDAVYVDDKLKDYLLSIVRATRGGIESLKELIEYGASPRASLALLRASKAHAFLAGRHFATPDDVKTMAPDVLRHRVQPSFEADAEDLKADDLIKRILNAVPVP